MSETYQRLICNHCKHAAHCGHSCLEETCDHCSECACDRCRSEEENYLDRGYN